MLCLKRVRKDLTEKPVLMVKMDPTGKLDLLEIMDQTE